MRIIGDRFRALREDKPEEKLYKHKPQVLKIKEERLMEMERLSEIKTPRDAIRHTDGIAKLKRNTPDNKTLFLFYALKTLDK